MLVRILLILHEVQAMRLVAKACVLPGLISPPMLHSVGGKALIAIRLGSRGLRWLCPGCWATCLSRCGDVAVAASQTQLVWCAISLVLIACDAAYMARC